VSVTVSVTVQMLMQMTTFDLSLAVVTASTEAIAFLTAIATVSSRVAAPAVLGAAETET
jgi:hypothetical protein